MTATFCLGCASGPLVSFAYARTHPGIPANRIHVEGGRCRACIVDLLRFCPTCGGGPLMSRTQADRLPRRPPPWREHGGRGQCRSCYRLTSPKPDQYCVECGTGPLLSKASHPRVTNRYRRGGHGKCRRCYDHARRCA